MKAIWNGTIIAESKNIVRVEGNSYFPVELISKDFVKNSCTRIVCLEKGTASYFDLVGDSKINADAVWHYPTPSVLAVSIKNRIAFWKEIQVVND